MTENELNRLLGQFLIVRCNADEDDKFTLDYCSRLKEKYHVENFFFYGTRRENFIKFSQKLRQNTEYHPFYSADFERGTGTNTSHGTDFPGNMALAATQDPQLAYLQGKAIAQEMKYLGLNWNYAPCIDVNYEDRNPVVNIRSFGEDPQLVSRMGKAICRGLEENGVLSCIKHYPGHGSVTEDSHSVLPVVEKEYERLIHEDLLPFHDIIADKATSAVMAAHLIVPALQQEEEKPASLSKRALSLLNKEWGFEGLVVPDALEMKGALLHQTPYGAGAEALKAGNHFVLVPEDPEKELDSLHKAVKDGCLPLDLLRRKLQTIAYYKKLVSQSTYYENKVDWEEHDRLSLTIARKSITALGFNKPLQKDERILLVNCINRHDQKLMIWQDRFTLCEELKKKGVRQIEECFYSVDEELPSFDESEYDRIVLALYFKIIIGSGSLQTSETLLGTITQLQQKYPEKTVIFSLADPYAAVNNFQHQQMLLSYSNSQASHQALVEVATGKRKSEGKTNSR